MSEKIKLIKDELVTGSKNESWTETANDAISSCTKIKKEREIKIVCDRFGIGKKPKTLNAIGLEYGLTRERIRQIVANTLSKIKKHCLSKSHLNKIKEIELYVEKRGGFTSLLELSGNFFVNDPKEINALQFVTSTYDRLTNLKESQEIRSGWFTNKVRPSDVKSISREATKIINDHKKTLNIKNIAEKINAPKELVESILIATKNLMRDDDGKWGLTSWPHINPKSIKDKSKHVLRKHGKPLHYSMLTKKIAEIGTKKVTKQSVHNELIKNREFVLIGRGIYALSEWGYTPGVIEEVIVSVLETAGEPLHKKEIVKRVMEKRIVKESTVILNLQKNRFKRVAKAIYTLN